MTSKSSNHNSSDEIDLGQLFHLIGKGFQKLYDFVLRIFQGIFQLVINLLLFFQKNFLILTVSLVVGAVAGFILDMVKTEKYVSRMLVEPNFNSVQQLYNNIDFYNDLAKAKDSIALADALTISVAEAASIKNIFIDSYSDENQKLMLFDDFVRRLDTSTVRAIDFESYLKNFNSLDARFHQISLFSTNSFVAKKAQPALVKSISANDYFRLQKRLNDVNITIKDSIINRQLVEIDSLQSLYKTILVKEADKPMQGTSINLAENGESQNKELALIKEREILKNQIVQLNQERANKSSILNIISDFPRRGVKVKGFWKSYKFVFPIILFFLSIFILLLMSLNTFLKNYNKE